MNLTLALFAAAMGYLLGSISFARLIVRIYAPHQDISKLKLAIPESEIQLESDAVSATTVRLHVGQKYGCLTSLLDMLKAALPALAFKLWQPDWPYYLVAAGFATVGHNWPLYYRFKGGRGLSPTLGGMLVVDWLGVLLTHIFSMVIGGPLNSLLIMMCGGIVLMVPWIWLRTHDWAKLAYVIAMNALFWISMLPELKTYNQLRRTGQLSEYMQAQRIRVLSRQDRDTAEQLTLVGSLSRLLARLRRTGP